MKFLIPIIVLIASPSAFAVTCTVSAPSDLATPFSFDHILWSGDVAGDTRRVFIPADLSVALEVTETQNQDKTFLAQHEGETSVSISKPYPGDQAADDYAIADSTVDTSQPFNRVFGSQATGSATASKEYGLNFVDLQRHVLVSCRAKAASVSAEAPSLNTSSGLF